MSLMQDWQLKQLYRILSDKFGIAALLNPQPHLSFAPLKFIHTTALHYGKLCSLKDGGKYGSSAHVGQHGTLTSLAEFIERFHILDSHKPEKILQTSWIELCELGLSAIGPDDLPLFSEKQFSECNFPFIRWSPNHKLNWRKGHRLNVSLNYDNEVWVPEDFIFQKSDASLCLYKTAPSGAAAGATIEMATLAALLENIERDSFLMHWWTGNKSSLVDKRAIELNKTTSATFRHLGFFNKSIDVFETTTALGIPTYHAVFRGKNKDGVPARCVTGAAHWQPAMAVEKSLREMSQVLTYLLDEQNLWITKTWSENYANEMSSFMDHAFFYALDKNSEIFDHWLPQKNSPHVQLEVSSDISVHEALEWIIEKLQTNNMNPIALDITADEYKTLPLKIVRVLVPGLNPISSNHKARALGVPRLLNSLGGNAPYAYPHPFP